MQAVIADYAALWSERDAARRWALVTASLTGNAIIVGPGYTLRGHAAIDADAARFQRERPGQRAVMHGGIDAHGALARFAVRVVDAGGGIVAEGLDVVELGDDGRIARVITFWGALPDEGIRWQAAAEPAAAPRAIERPPATPFAIDVCDGVPAADAAIVDHGLGMSNDRFAPLHDVQPLACFARAQGRVIGGAIGRTWGACCQLQQLWVDDGWRKTGVGSQLMRAFEARAHERGARTYYLDTFSFQAPEFYRRFGYEAALTIEGFAPGVTFFTMMRRD